MHVDVATINDPEVRELAREAENFLTSHTWCRSVVAGRLAFAIPAVLGVFLFDIVPAQPEIDATLWVVVGDVPPAYLAVDPDASWQSALAGYVDEMRLWIAAVRAGTPTTDLIPVDAEPTLEHADMLASRLDFIEAQLIEVPPASIESAG
ncbi:MAG: hypothetical protein HS104_03225 [Polyangiaceae bacterium]|nr:hypothetical protein [Polyangiaceae bacterium]